MEALEARSGHAGAAGAKLASAGPAAEPDPRPCVASTVNRLRLACGSALVRCPSAPRAIRQLPTYLASALPRHT